MSNIPVLLYVPNIIDYVRLIFLLIAWFYIDHAPTFLIFYITQAFLDFFDGYFAKLLNQTSQFGAWLDVVLDNFGRGILWVHLYRAGYLITMVEWIAFGFIQKLNSKDWKNLFENTPFLVRHVFKNNFKSPMGITAITAGLQGLPVILYIIRYYSDQFNPIWSLFFYSMLVYAILGRALCLYVELWMICKNLGIMIFNKEN